MRIECSSISKYRNLSLDGDDVLAVLPSRLYAVFDGATDAVGVSVNGQSPGRFAATCAAMAVMRANTRSRNPCSPDALLNAMNTAIRLGLKEAKAQGVNACTTAAIVQDSGENLDFFIVGDSGIRINGNELVHLSKDIDAIFTSARLHLYRLLRGKGMVADELELYTRKLVNKGLSTAEPAWLTEQDIASVIAVTTASCRPQLKPDAICLIEDILHKGIARGQYQFANQSGHSLGFAVINGGFTQGPDMLHFSRPKIEVCSIELFTDGYFSLPNGTYVRDWEDEFFRVESADFSKSDTYTAIKGSMTDSYSDDRTVLTVHFSGA